MREQAFNSQLCYVQPMLGVFSFFSSLLVHILIILSVLYYYYVFPNRLIMPEFNEQVITVDLIAPPNAVISNSVNITNPLSSNTSTYEPSHYESLKLNKTQNHLEEPNLNWPSEEKSFQPTSENPIPSPFEIRYGIIFASHIKRIALQFPDKVNFHKKVEIMLKIDKAGNIKQYKVLNTRNKLIKQTVAKILNAASPLPKPPIESFSSDYIIYKFYLSFG